MKKFMFIYFALVVALAACWNDQANTAENSSQIDDSLEGLTCSTEKEARNF
ncbi:hypothetical protein ACDX78_02725 [Virgibacillus oceani]